jgi:hypothetical protein
MFTKSKSQPRTSFQIVRASGRSWQAVAALWLSVTACGSEVTPVGTGSEELRRCRPANGVTLRTNEEIQSFAGCQVLEGSLQVRHDVTDLSPLSSLKVIEGSISGGGYQFKPFSLDALESLEVIGEDLHFLNDNVTSFLGISKVHTVGGGLRLFEVPEIEDLRGLEKVATLGYLTISYNPKLRTLAGLDGLQVVKGDVRIGGNDLVPDEEVNALLARIQVGGSIHLD